MTTISIRNSFSDDYCDTFTAPITEQIIAEITADQFIADCAYQAITQTS